MLKFDGPTLAAAPSGCWGHPSPSHCDTPTFPMKKTYLTPYVSMHGRVEEITAFFGGGSQQDVVLDGADNVVLTGLGEINGCLISNNAVVETFGCRR